MKTTFSLPGLHCASCEALVKNVSSEFPEVRTVDVNLATKQVTLDHEEGFDPSSWKRALEELGEAYHVQEE